jgi:hypothetical protein
LGSGSLDNDFAPKLKNGFKAVTPQILGRDSFELISRQFAPLKDGRERAHRFVASSRMSAISRLEERISFLPRPDLSSPESGAVLFRLPVAPTFTSPVIPAELSLLKYLERLQVPAHEGS